jgi:hypothetical protein
MLKVDALILPKVVKKYTIRSRGPNIQLVPAVVGHTLGWAMGCIGIFAT